MVYGLSKYGLTVPMWYDPVRPDEFSADDAKYLLNTGNHLNTVLDLQIYFIKYRGAQNYNECIIHHNWWVQRSSNFAPVYPPTPVTSSGGGKGGGSTSVTGPALLYGYPSVASQQAWNNVPFISCEAGSGNANGLTAPRSGTPSADPKDCSPNTAHFYNGILRGVNAAYADGHVETHLQLDMNCGYSQSNPYWFY
jgi:prepilin-type processing-associated H-X9-DG protein